MTKTDLQSKVNVSQWQNWLKKNYANAERYRNERFSSTEFGYFEFNELPIFLGESLHKEMQYQTQMLTDVISTLGTMCVLKKLDLDGKPLDEWLDIPNHVFYWIRKFHNPARRFPWGRPDFNIVQGKPVCLELNIAAAAGYQMQCGSIASYFEEHPAFEALFAEGNAVCLDPLEGFISTLGRVTKSGESILFADIREPDRHPTTAEMPYFGLINLIKKFCDLRLTGGFIEDLDLRSDGVYLAGQRMNKIFLSYYNPHDFSRFADFLPLWHQHEKGTVECLDSLDEILLSNKMLFAFASEFVDSLPISFALKRFVHSSVPWTRILRDAKTTYRGESFDMWTLATSKKSSFVLKKAQSAEGKDVFIGAWTQETEWRALLERAFASGGWILQEFAPLQDVPVALWKPKSEKDRDGNTSLELRDEGRAMVTMSPYVAQGVSVGYCVRHYRAPESVEGSNVQANAIPIKRQALQPFAGVIITPESD